MGAHTPSWNDRLRDAAAAHTPRPRPDDSSGSITPDVLASVEAQIRDIVSAPGMYEETDHGIRLTLPIAEDEDRITSGVPSPADGLDVSEHSHPSLFEPFGHRRVTLVRVNDKGPDERLTGYPVDAWRAGGTALGVRVTFERGGQFGDAMMLADNEAWHVEVEGEIELTHLPHDNWL